MIGCIILPTHHKPNEMWLWGPRHHYDEVLNGNKYDKHLFCEVKNIISILKGERKANALVNLISCSIVAIDESLDFL